MDEGFNTNSRRKELPTSLSAALGIAIEAEETSSSSSLYQAPGGEGSGPNKRAKLGGEGGGGFISSSTTVVGLPPLPLPPPQLPIAAAANGSGGSGGECLVPLPPPRLGKAAVPEKVEVPSVAFSKVESAPQISFSKDLKEVTGEKGYRMAKATDGVLSGKYYWECEILPSETAEAHCRLGWSLRQGDNQAPVGYDKYSYGYRDVQGSKIHESVREDNYGEPYGPGDVIGFGICLPILPKHMQEAILPPTLQESINNSNSSTKTGQGEMDEALANELAALVNHIRFFKNGVDQGPAYKQIPGGRYFPAVSLYMGARVRANFGPRWICEPKTKIRYQALSSVKPPLSKEDMKSYCESIEERRLDFRRRERSREEGGAQEEMQQEGKEIKEQDKDKPSQSVSDGGDEETGG